MAIRTFTLEEAHSLLPLLEALLRRAMQGKQQLQQFDEEFRQVTSRIFLNGGTLIDVVRLKARKAKREATLLQVQDVLSEIDALGVQVKDLDMGLLDFPCQVDDEIILLCWKMGEKRIAFWHNTEEGFRGRKPIDDRIARAKPDKPIS
jgi:hypothetical protein